MHFRRQIRTNMYLQLIFEEVVKSGKTREEVLWTGKWGRKDADVRETHGREQEAVSDRLHDQLCLWLTLVSCGPVLEAVPSPVIICVSL